MPPSPQQQQQQQHEINPINEIEHLEEATTITPKRNWMCTRNATNNSTTTPPPPPQEQQEEEAQSFLKYILTTPGPPQIILWSLFYAIATGCTLSVIPTVITDRYARLSHNFTSPHSCSTYPASHKPPPCRLASNDAMNASAISSFLQNILTFFTGPLTGSISDEYGRRNLLLASSFLSLFSPLYLVLLQLDDGMNPAWYYGVDAIRGLLSWMAIALASLSDVLPPKWRAPGFGLLMAGFSAGFATSPLLAIWLDHLYLSVFSFGLLVVMFGLALCLLPETLAKEQCEENRRRRIARLDGAERESKWECVVRNVKRPVEEMLILNRTRLFRLLASLAFFSGLVLSADTLLALYVQDKFGATDKDVAVFLVMLGVMNITVQGFVLKPLNDCVGEKWVLIVAFLFGSIHNLCYGLGTSKAFIYIGGALSSIRVMAFPTVSAIKANNVEENEQGRIQGALYAASCLASAIGPIMLRFVYYGAETEHFLGSGVMFVAAAVLDIVAVMVSCVLPKDKVDSRGQRNGDDDDDEADISRNDNSNNDGGGVAVDGTNLSTPLLDDVNTT